jgi:hypothetical protein
LGAGLLACALGGTVQFAGWLRLRSTLRTWVLFTVAWQLVVLLAVGVYVGVGSRGSHGSAAWIAPAVGLVVGTALPLQAVVIGLLRSLSRP